ncbi:diaminopropionate ammonia-lyase [uncultured Devosia sp.]|uniref:diaminopropionate ammonia-lyase n=1 Tax=uncultured Devosia sp. TaxID=211434 RepID=UPI0035CB7506
MQAFPVRHQSNPRLHRQAPYGARQQAVLNGERFTHARAEITTWPGYAPTPVVSLPGLAAAIGVGELRYKDEGLRFGLKSFKALGGAYAALVLLAEHLQAQGIAQPRSADIMAGLYADQARTVTLAAATDGNHGRSVAWGAQMFGCRCIIYLHEHVSQSREAEIARYGAEIRRIRGGYDNSVHQCASDARTHGWQLVADTSANGDAKAPALVMQGYTLLVAEMLAQWAPVIPTHIFVPGAVGGLAAATVGHLWETMGSDRPRIVVVQPDNADCISRSLAAGKPTLVPGDVNTFMACLAAAEVSPAAWDILEEGLDHTITIPDDAARDAMRLLADGVGGDRPLVSGESGCAATAGLVAAMYDAEVASALGLGSQSRVAVVGSEGATDADAYRATVGRTPEAVIAKGLSHA